MRHALWPLALVLAAACAVPGFSEDTGEEGHHCRWSWHSVSDFAWQAQVDQPVKDLGRALDDRVGLGIGMQWTRYRSSGAANRTRLEWNVFPEGNPVGLNGTKTQASNVILSFDRLYHLSGGDQGVYILGGLGGVRWSVDRSPASGGGDSFHTTKFAVTAGAGYRFNRAMSAEVRYLISSVDKTYDGNVLQTGISVRF